VALRQTHLTATCTQDPTRIPAGVWSPLAEGATPTRQRRS
jgi:hypothetical protein